ncbi:uncharacterized protein A4U43_C01F18070 [Asparagus officinalis]|uniref:3-methyl-2-oxobutanoate hydroxymethyltransferase n=1 Tax=Asparagus officinalis TaxID=4686 RepID=A0A5P1FUV2_ASPOF|nr:uncharacterized protein A4U43_C01F18070 [Asparagus officinalis]
MVQVVETAMALQEAGCFSVVLECVPAPVAAATTKALQIPTIGIGAGPFCSGQVTPKFCKTIWACSDVINKRSLEYKHEVESKSFPGQITLHTELVRLMLMVYEELETMV